METILITMQVKADRLRQAGDLRGALAVYAKAADYAVSIGKAEAAKALRERVQSLSKTVGESA